MSILGSVTGMENTQKVSETTGYNPCHCLCSEAHPADRGICEAENAVIARRFETELLGSVDVPLCAPCCVAQGVTELMTET